MKWKLDMSASDLRWRSELAPDCRPRQFIRIFENVKTCFKNCALVDLDELYQMAEWLEDEIYNDAISHMDYLSKVYLKILNMQTRVQTTAGNGSHGMQSQVHNQGQAQIPLPNQFQARQSHNVQNTIVSVGAQSFSYLPPALPSMTTQTSVPNADVQRINMQSRIAQNFVGSSVSQGLPSNMFSNTQWRPGRNQLQQFTSQQQHQLMKKNLLQPTQMSNAVGRSTNTQSEIALAQYLFPKQKQQQQHQLMKQNLLQPTQMLNAVGRSTNTQSEIALAQYLFPKHQQQQHQLMNPQLYFSPMTSTAQTGQNAVDWEEDIYEMMQSMKEHYLPYLNEIHHKISKECQKLKRKISVLNVSQCERQKLLSLLKYHIHFLDVPKNWIVPTMKGLLTAFQTQRIASVLNLPPCEKENLFHLLESRIQSLNVPKYIMKDMLSDYEMQLIHLINSNLPRKHVSVQQQIQQLGGGHPLSMQPQQKEEEVDNQPDATHKIIDVTGPKTTDYSD